MGIDAGVVQKSQDHLAFVVQPTSAHREAGCDAQRSNGVIFTSCGIEHHAFVMSTSLVDMTGGTTAQRPATLAILGDVNRSWCINSIASIPRPGFMLPMAGPTGCSPKAGGAHYCCGGRVLEDGPAWKDPTPMA